MSSNSSPLNLAVQLLNIVRNCKKHTFCINICISAAEKSSESSVPFQIRKTAFRLNASIDSKQNPLVTYDSLKAFRSLSFKLS